MDKVFHLSESGSINFVQLDQYWMFQFTTFKYQLNKYASAGQRLDNLWSFDCGFGSCFFKENKI